MKTIPKISTSENINEEHGNWNVNKEFGNKNANKEIGNANVSEELENENENVNEDFNEVNYVLETWNQFD